VSLSLTNRTALLQDGEARLTQPATPTTNKVALHFLQTDDAFLLKYHKNKGTVTRTSSVILRFKRNSTVASVFPLDSFRACRIFSWEK
jgi:hypothetical protein